MIMYSIALDSITKVKNFVNTISKFDYGFELISGKHTINAKSIMGVFSLNLSEPIDLVVTCENEDPQLIKALEPYLNK